MEALLELVMYVSFYAQFSFAIPWQCRRSDMERIDFTAREMFSLVPMFDCGQPGTPSWTELRGYFMDGLEHGWTLKTCEYGCDYCPPGTYAGR